MNPPSQQQRHAVLLLLLLAAMSLVVAVTAAPTPGHDHELVIKGIQQQKHFPRMDVAQQKAMSLLQEQPLQQRQQPTSSQPKSANASQVLLPTPLLPACVPMYVTDLVIPPPMPVSAVPVAEVRITVPSCCMLRGASAPITFTMYPANSVFHLQKGPTRRTSLTPLYIWD